MTLCMMSSSHAHKWLMGSAWVMSDKNERKVTAKQSMLCNPATCIITRRTQKPNKRDLVGFEGYRSSLLGTYHRTPFAMPDTSPNRADLLISCTTINFDHCASGLFRSSYFPPHGLIISLRLDSDRGISRLGSNIYIKPCSPITFVIECPVATDDSVTKPEVCHHSRR